MSVESILEQLTAKADPKVRLSHLKAGAGETALGVKMGEIRAIAKPLKKDHTLGQKLWATGIFEARMVAVLILQPKLLDSGELTALIQDNRSTYVADWMSTHLIKPHPSSEFLRAEWMEAEDAMLQRAGWSLTASKIASEPNSLNLDALLDRLEAEMPVADPAAQWTMNFCLAHIGIYSEPHRSRALEIGERLRIYRDYPTSPGCTSPFAPICINEMARRLRACTLA